MIATIAIYNRDKMGDSIQYWREAKASLGAALIAESVVLPIDTVKIAIQTAPPGLRPGIAATTRDLWRTGGWSAFYRAWPPAVVRQMAFTSIRFGSYSQMTPWLKTQKSQVWLPMLTAASVGLVANGIALPADVIKRQLQAYREKRGTWSQIRLLWGEEGWKGFYRGWWQTTQRSVLISGIQLPVYFAISDYLRPRPWPLWWRNTLSSGITTLAVTTVVYPVDLFTSLLMTWRQKYPTGQVYSTVHFLRSWSQQKGGWRTLYRGYSVALAKALPQFWLLSYCYEWLRDGGT